MQSIPNYDASFCGKLPPHQTNLVQPHGVLFVLDSGSQIIVQVSDNLEALCGKKPSSVLKQPFADLLAAGSDTLTAVAGDGNMQPLQLMVQTTEGPRNCSAMAHARNGLLYVEVLLPQVVDGAGRSFLSAYQEIRNFLHNITGKPDVTSFAEAVALEMQRVTGFDKVMVYSFDKDWNGTVIAEERPEDMDAYLGLRFPASDIPKPVRELYRKNPYRFIPDSGYQPARLFPLLHPQTNSFTDLSSCNLRSVAAVHLEYLKNMEVSASLSLRMIHNGELWGLVSCHHRQPLYFSFEAMGFFELLSEIISSQLSIVVNNSISGRRSYLQTQLTGLVPQLLELESFEESLTLNAGAIQQLLGATGLVFQYNGFMYTSGIVPHAQDLQALLYWLEVQQPDQVMHLPSLPSHFDEAEAFADTGSGLLAIPFEPSRGAFVLAFRPEAIAEVAWGGNPHEALQFEADGKTYHPRNSFNIWKQTVRHTAQPWTPEELEMAGALQHVLTRLALRTMNA